MPNFNLKQFKGLTQHVAFEELAPDRCHTLSNLDVDNPLGKLTLRGGYQKLETDAFTDLISAYEYEYPTSGNIILLFNDNGTLKYYTDGGSLASLALPSGATLAANFRNQFFGFQDHILLTAGNGATNYVLGFYYLKRVNADNTGLFGDNEQFTGYKLLKSQLVPPNGIFSAVNDIVAFGGFYYTSFYIHFLTGLRGKYIEKRDSNFQLLDRFVAHDDATNYDGVYLAADSSNIFMGIDDKIYRINPNGWITDESVTLGTSPITGIAVDDTRLYVCTSTALYAYTKSNFGAGVDSSDTTSFVGEDVDADLTGTSTHIWVINGSTGDLERRDKTAVGTVSHNVAVTVVTGKNKVHYDSGGTQLFVSEITNDEIEEFSPSDLSATTTHTHVEDPGAYIEISGTSYVVGRTNGILVVADTATVYKPDLISLAAWYQTSLASTRPIGTFWYKISIVDTDGQEYTLSDPAISLNDVVGIAKVRIVVNESQLNDFYRVSKINVYRAYNSDEEALAPATNYKFLRTIDINDDGWVNDATLNLYYFEFTDDVPESTISSVTFEENAGFSGNTKPRVVNYKVHEWINNQLHAANFYVDGKTYQNKIAKSQVNGPDVIPFANTYDFDPYDGDEILNMTTAYSRAYIMKSRRTGIFFNDKLERRLGQGLADIDAYYTDVDTIYLMSDKGLFEINGANIRALHDPVITSFNAISSFTDATVFLRDDFDRIFFTIPQDRVLVWNRKHNVWTQYSSAYAFRGYYKNLSNQYIGFGTIPGDIHFFVNFDDGTQDIGDDIVISYESPLLKLDEVDGFHSELTQLYSRQKSTGTFTLKIFDWRSDSKATALTLILTDLTTISTQVKHLQGIWGEAFSIELTGFGTVFEFASLTLQYVPAGLAEEMHS